MRFSPLGSISISFKVSRTSSGDTLILPATRETSLTLLRILLAILGVPREQLAILIRANSSSSTWSLEELLLIMVDRSEGE